MTQTNVPGYNEEKRTNILERVGGNEENVAALLSVFIFVCATCWQGSFTPAVRSSKKEYVAITVAPGDTLWGLAKQYEQEHHMPPDEFIRWVVDVNHLPSPRLAAGEQIVIPVLKSKQGGSVAVNQ